ncbi:MAG: hypothetical protein LBU73_01220, partial [Helicobacteraceae bacterium]|nr:hypothetical protein [Helicobacteraceae bacterium]
ISTAMGQVDSITQQNAATSEQSAAAAEEMSAQANAMMESVAELGKIVGLRINAGEISAQKAQKAERVKSRAYKNAATQTDYLIDEFPAGLLAPARLV